MTFEHLIIDEANQINEPEIIKPISKGIKHLVLIGDHL